MNNTINSDLIRGNIDTIILRALYGSDRYGYDIIKEIEQRSSGKYKLKQPTLYSCLNRLENQGFIRSYWGTKSIGGRRKYYTLTDMGKELFIKNRTDWEYSKILIDNLITDSDDGEASSRPIIDSSKNDEFFSSLEACDETEFQADEDEQYLAAEQTDEDEQSLVAEQADEDEQYLAAEQADEDEQCLAEQADEDEQYLVASDASVEVESLEYAELDEREFEREVENLFRNSGSRNYIDKIKEEQYTPDKNIYMDEHLRAESYFQDFEDMEDDEDEEDAKQSEIIVPTPMPIREEREVERKSATGSFVSYKANTKSERETGEYRSREEIYNIFEKKLAAAKSQPQEQPQPKEPKDIYKIFEDKLAGIKSQPQEQPQPKEPKDIYKIFEDKLAGIKSQPQEQPQPKEQKDIYKIFEDKLAGANKKRDNEIENVYIAPISEEDIATEDDPEFYRKDQIQIRNFKKLQDSAADMGEGIKIRSYETTASREFNEQYYFYSNKLKLRQYFILFCVILFEVIVCYMAVNLGLHKSAVVSSNDLLIYVLAVILGLTFPAIAFGLNWTNPNKRKRVSYNFSLQLLFGIIVMVQLMLIVYFTNVYFGMPLAVDSDHYNSLIVPLVLCTNIPINTIIFNLLFKSKKFSV